MVNIKVHTFSNGKSIVILAWLLANQELSNYVRSLEFSLIE